MQIQTVQTPAETPATYKVTLTDGTVLWVPEDAANRDYAVVQAWLESGGTIS